MIFRRRFELDVEELRPEMAILKAAHDEVRTSAAFKWVLAVVLAHGNTLNGGTFRGSAAGFRLDDLLKLRDTKAGLQGGPPTLLHFIARELEKMDPDLLDLTSHMPHLEAASRGKISGLAVDETYVCYSVDD